MWVEYAINVIGDGNSRPHSVFILGCLNRREQVGQSYRLSFWGGGGRFIGNILTIVDSNIYIIVLIINGHNMDY
jgi:hypothetical protein